MSNTQRTLCYGGIPDILAGTQAVSCLVGTSANGGKLYELDLHLIAYRLFSCPPFSWHEAFNAPLPEKSVGWRIPYHAHHPNASGRGSHRCEE